MTATNSDSANEGALAGISQGYEELVNAVIRPPRMNYNQETDLGPASFQYCGRRFRRNDFELKNPRGHKLACSWWKFEPEDAPSQQLPCVIYLHGNASCRLAAFELLKHLLPAAITVFSLDFSGAGLSGGDYVSLGYHEQEDVAAAIAHLRASGEVSTIGLWGHSMGAVTALLYGDRDPSIAGMVVDSAFSDLMQLVNELGQNFREQGLRVPGFAISMAVQLIRRSVRNRAKFDPTEVSPISKVGQSFIPALFAHGEKDNFIKPVHSRELHDAYAGDKNLVLFDGDHNSPRPEFLHDSAVIFLRQTLGVQDAHCLDRNSPQHKQGALDRRFSGAGAVRKAEEEMMRQAMMLSMINGGNGSVEQAPSPQAAGGAAESVATRAPRVSHAALQEGVQQFQAITGVNERVAQFYVETALSQGAPVEVAIAQYYDSDCAEPPPQWRPVS